MARELQSDVELIIIGFLMDSALAQLVWGQVSDAIGRRRPPFIIGFASTEIH